MSGAGDLVDPPGSSSSSTLTSSADMSEVTTSSSTIQSSVGVRGEGLGLPLEWDALPVDVKYSRPYVGLGLLRQEQEVTSGELRGVPDTNKVTEIYTHICLLVSPKCT